MTTPAATVDVKGEQQSLATLGGNWRRHFLFRGAHYIFQV